MTALLRKDFYILGKYLWVFALLVVFMTAVSEGFYTVFAVVLVSMLPFAALDYDRQSRWEQLAVMMPYSIRDIVLSKYALGWIGMAGAAAVCLAVSFAQGIFGHTGSDFPTPAMALLTGVITMDVTLPLAFRCGAERGKAWFLLVNLMVMFVGNLGSFAANAVSAPGSPNLLIRWNVFLFLAAAAATILSVPLSMRMYQKYW